MGGTLPSDEFGLLHTAIDGKYVVESVVAAGGFGVVYRGRHHVLGSAVALKVLRVPQALNDDARRTFVHMFLNEARIVASLSHPAVVRAMDFGAVVYAEGHEAPWMALDWIDGVTLARDLDARRGRGGRTPGEALALLAPVIEALAEAHEVGVVHRDVKPGNVMLPTARGRRGAADIRLLDFGIAKVMGGDDTTTSGHTLTDSSIPAYSPRYAAPEQVSRMRTGPWTDVHALGLILTELLTDRCPYEGDKLQLTAQAMAVTRPTPAHFGVAVGPWEDVLARALALHPNDRYPNARALLDALEATVAEADRALMDGRAPTPIDEPTLTRPLPTPSPGRAPVQPLGAGTISAMVVPGGPQEAPSEAPRGRSVVRGLAVVAAAVVAAVTAFVLGRPPARTVRANQAMTVARPAAASRGEAPVVAAPQPVAQVVAAPVAAAVVPAARAPIAATPVVQTPRAPTPSARPTGRAGASPRARGPRPGGPSTPRVDERPPLE